MLVGVGVVVEKTFEGGRALLTQRVEELGYRKAKDLMAYDYDVRATPGRCPECGAVPEGVTG